MDADGEALVLEGGAQGGQETLVDGSIFDDADCHRFEVIDRHRIADLGNRAAAEYE
jgi:hypothetical protein